MKKWWFPLKYQHESEVHCSFKTPHASLVISMFSWAINRKDNPCVSSRYEWLYGPLMVWLMWPPIQNLSPKLQNSQKLSLLCFSLGSLHVSFFREAEREREIKKEMWLGDVLKFITSIPYLPETQLRVICLRSSTPLGQIAARWHSTRWHARL